MVGLAQSNQQPSRDLKISETLDPPGGSHHHCLVGSQNSITWAPGEGNACPPFPPVTCIAGAGLAFVVHLCNRWRGDSRAQAGDSNLVLGTKNYFLWHCLLPLDATLLLRQMVMMQAGKGH